MAEDTGGYEGGKNTPDQINKAPKPQERAKKADIDSAGAEVVAKIAGDTPTDSTKRLKAIAGEADDSGRNGSPTESTRRSSEKKGKPSRTGQAAILALSFLAGESPRDVQAETDHGAHTINTQIVEKQHVIKDREELGKIINDKKPDGPDTLPFDTGGVEGAMNGVREAGGINPFLEKGRVDLDDSLNRLAKELPFAKKETSQYGDLAMKLATGVISTVISEKVRDAMKDSYKNKGGLEDDNWDLNDGNPNNMWVNKTDTLPHGWKITYGVNPDPMAAGVEISTDF